LTYLLLFVYLFRILSIFVFVISFMFIYNNPSFFLEISYTYILENVFY
jgi:hypothetical protein